jgi:hypothetical protein
MLLILASTGETITNCSSIQLSSYQTQGVILDASGAVHRSDSADTGNLYFYTPVLDQTRPIRPIEWCYGIVSCLVPLHKNLDGHAKGLEAAIEGTRIGVVRMVARNKGLLLNLSGDLAFAQDVRMWDGRRLVDHIPASISIWAENCRGKLDTYQGRADSLFEAGDWVREATRAELDTQLMFDQSEGSSYQEQGILIFLTKRTHLASSY